MMELLIEKMQKLLASSFAMYLKTHQFHWNVEGQDFHQYHRYLGKLYTEIWESVDTTAEQIRALGAKAKGSLADYKELSAIRDQITPLTIQEMNAQLYRDNLTILSILDEVHDEGEKLRAFGLLNYIEGRMDVHRKHSWMLRASMEPVSTPVSESTEEVEVETEEAVLAEEVVKVYTLNPRDM